MAQIHRAMQIKRKMMNITIVGQGAIGSLLAYYYRAQSPILLVKNKLASAKTIVDLSGKSHLLDFTILDVSEPYSEPYLHQSIDCIVISVKGYQLKALITQMQPWLNKNTRIVLIQNGMGGAQMLASAFPDNLIYTGITTDAAYKTDLNTYQISAQGRLDLGPVWTMLNTSQHVSNPYQVEGIDLDEERAWINAFLSIHPQAHYHTHIASALYKKLAINAVINPLTAIMKLKNGELLKHTVLVNDVKEEIFSIYTAHALGFDDTSLSNAIDDVIKSTSNNVSSMYQDVKQKRQTENETVLGYLLNMAASKKIATPTLLSLYNKINALDAVHYRHE